MAARPKTHGDAISQNPARKLIALAKLIASNGRLRGIMMRPPHLPNLRSNRCDGPTGLSHIVPPRYEPITEYRGCARLVVAGIRDGGREASVPLWQVHPRAMMPAANP
jgi:hypothetical protein